MGGHVEDRESMELFLLEILLIFGMLLTLCCVSPALVLNFIIFLNIYKSCKVTVDLCVSVNKSSAIGDYLILDDHIALFRDSTTRGIHL